MMKVVIFFIASLGGGVLVGAAGRGFMMDPPVVEEEQQEAHQSATDSGNGVIEGGAAEGHDPYAEATIITDPGAGVEEGFEGGLASENGDPLAGAEEIDGNMADAPETVPENGEGVSGTGGVEDADTRPRPASPQPSVQGDVQSGTQGGEEANGAQARLAQIFGSMDAKAAASVLVELSDTEITEILAHLSARKAGNIIKSMPAERAATLSRVMLMTGGGDA